MNLSGSGVSFTQRTKWGSFGTRGYSLRTGIPGLTYRKRYRKSEGAELFALFAFFALLTGLLVLVLQICAFLLKWLLIGVAYAVDFVLQIGKWCILTACDFVRYSIQEFKNRHTLRPPVMEDAVPIEASEPTVYFTVDCPSCGVRIEYPAQLAGQSAECPKCHQQTVLPLKTS